MTANEKVTSLQRLMKEHGLSGYLIPSSDPHMSECPPAHWESRSFFSGFNGSAGTLVVTQDKSALWTDGRYFIQAERQIAGSGIELMRQDTAGVPSIAEWLRQELPENSVLGFDGSSNSASSIHGLETKLEGRNIQMKSIDLITPIWKNRPAPPATECFLLDVKYAGQTMLEKLEQLKTALQEKQADGMLVTRLDDLAWLLNLRAHDIANTPYLLAFCLVTAEQVTLFTDESRLPEQVSVQLSDNQIQVSPYGDILSSLSAITAPVKMLSDADAISIDCWNIMKANPDITLVPGTDPIQLMKSIKNQVEVESLISSHVKDGVAMVRFERELRDRLSRGEQLTECDASEILYRQRSSQPLFVEESFISIVAYGANAAMMHYHPQQDHCSVLEPHGLLLADCGGQYLDGTTDITRTYSLGELTDEEKQAYTLALKCHIGLARAVFPEGCTGANLDVLSRIHVWRQGLDYRCGTGHGVSFLGGVHEGPQSLRITNHVPFKAGMIITVEPGIYQEGAVGVRTENEMLCAPAMETEYGKFLCFQAITFAPIDKAPILTHLLDAAELDWFNEYHQLVIEKLSPQLNQEEQAWLLEKCSPLSR